jgi:hypothetical protein
MTWWLTGMLFATAGVVALAGAIAKKRAEQLKTQERLREEFCRHVEAILADPEASDNVASLMLYMATRETSRWFLWSFVLLAISGKLSDSADSTALKIYQEVPGHLRKDYVSAVIKFAIGVTYNNMLLGLLVRRLMFFGVSRRGGDGTESISPVAPILDEFSRGGMHPA